MAGFGPIASTPVAALPSAGGTILGPGKATITITGRTPAIIGTDPVQVGQMVREVMLTGPSELRVGQMSREVMLTEGNASVRVGMMVREVLMSSNAAQGVGGSISILW